MQRNTLTRELLAEFLGTAIVILFGAGVVAQNVLSNGSNGSYLAINLAWGLGVAMAVYTTGGVTGAHLNPAVTLAVAVRRGLPWNKVLPYWGAQVIGAFVGAALVFLVYHEAFKAYDGGARMVEGAKATAGIFATYPSQHLSAFGGLIDQIVGTGVLMLVICALGDNRNLAPGSNLGPLIVGLLVVVIGMSLGFNCGYAINPARDLGPRLFTFVAGWGGSVFTAGNNWFWVPIVGPLIGGVAGAKLYDLMIGNHMPDPDSAAS